ncbi:MAG: hypothetical protein JWO36_2857 [Myxococcales bacterium]|nr:hypothetical protein [Myxococcales bacterium]
MSDVTAAAGSDHRAPGLDLVRLMLGEAQEYWDVDGRPLIEDRIELFERKRCPYPGIRLGRMMNLSALKQMGSHWDDVLGGMAFLATEHMKRMKRAQPELLDWYQIASMAVALPIYLLFRARDPVANHHLPGFVASMMKAAFDIGTTTKLLLARSFVGQPVPTAPEEIANVAEQEKLFLKGADGVCAGSPKHIESFVRALSLRAPVSKDAAALRELVPEMGTFLEYSDGFASMDCLILLLRAEATTATRVILKALPGERFSDERSLIESGLQAITSTTTMSGLVADVMEKPEHRELVLAGFAPGLLVTVDESAVARGLLELATGSPLSKQVGAAQLDAIVRAVAAYLCLERAILGRLEAQQLAANQALVRSAGRKPETSDVGMLLRTPTSVISMLTGIRFANRSNDTKISLKTKSFQF